MRLRYDLQYLNDLGVIDVPLTAWPVALGDIYQVLENVRNVDPYIDPVVQRVSDRLRTELDIGTVSLGYSLSGSADPRFVRTFENTPREEGEARVRLNWLGDRFAVNLSASYAANPFDGDRLRPDGSYLGVALGNWMITAGWQERWWGPGRDGGLILSSNARPAPGITLQRIASKPFETKWLRWIGPWTLTTFMSELDDNRVVRNARLFGFRTSFRPPGTGLEIGISRAAQWCGDSRPCDLSTFFDLIAGNDNRGVNVDPEDEPGNQLGGFDVRWRLPRGMPAAVYMQWIGEDGRGGGGAIGSWLRQLGIEHWGRIGNLRHRTHVEVSDTTCREGGFGFSPEVPNCAYNHNIYRTGYRYLGKAMGHGTDGDSRSYSMGSTLVQSAGHSWNASLRYMKINRVGIADPQHTITPTPVSQADIQLTHERITRIGRIYAGIGASRREDDATGQKDSDVFGFVRWSSQ